jgi:Arc/MetJ-type ribon-helix-helix transcriptional regulator
MKVVPVRLDDRKLKDLDMLVKVGIYKNRSDALRKIIENGMRKVEAEIEYLKKIDVIVDRIIDSDLNFGGVLRKSLEEGRDRW